MLPLVEKTAVVVLEWTKKALEAEQDVIGMVKKELEHSGKLLLIPTSDRDIVLITATQEALEEEAERCKLVKERKIVSTKRGTKETIFLMDHFQRANRQDFIKRNTFNRDVHGLFTVHDWSHLVMGILDRIILEPSHSLTQILHDNQDYSIGSKNKKYRHLAQPIRYVLRHKDWIDIITPLHVDFIKNDIQKKTWYPLTQLMPPIDAICEYYGPHVAYYFAFMGYFTIRMGLLGIAGVIVFLYRVSRNVTIDEDQYTPFYGMICFLWAILTLRFWERYEHQLAYRWGTLPIATISSAVSSSLNEQQPQQQIFLTNTTESHLRPEFHGLFRPSPITGKPELYYPAWRRRIQYVVSTIITIMLLGVAFSVMILSLNLQGYIKPRQNMYHPFYYETFALLSEPENWLDAQSWRAYIPVILHVICIFCMNAMYRRISITLTDWENHPTEVAYGNSLILKRFLFEAFDCYVVLFYLAFFERDVERLRNELVAVFNVDSFRRLFVEVILPLILHMYNNKNVKADHPHDLHLDEYEQFDDYMEIIIQFGYVTLFASAYPMASALMFGAMWIEIRSDCYKMTFLCQKPVSERVPSIGMWLGLLKTMVWLSCLTNCLLFGFTSDQMMQYLPAFYVTDEKGRTHLVEDRGWLAIFIIFGVERLLILIGLAINALVPPVSERLENELKRRHYLLSATNENLLSPGGEKFD